MASQEKDARDGSCITVPSQTFQADTRPPAAVNSGHITLQAALNPPRHIYAYHGPLSVRSDTEVYRRSGSLRHRNTRGGGRKIDDWDDFQTYGLPDGWQPGSEPGFDPKLPDGGHASMPTLKAECEITVVDFSPADFTTKRFNNETFISFLAARPRESWAKCRWININGLSWDVIQAVGKEKGLHKLALEDIMNIRNRTKVDWYSNHAFIILTLQKLVHIVDNDKSHAVSVGARSRSWLSRMFSLVSGRAPWRRVADTEHYVRDAEGRPILSDGSVLHETSMLRSLQRYHASGNEARTRFMEQHSPLAKYNMAVSAEQVSIFLTNDNTVISFFEISAAGVEKPIITRLSTLGTALRGSCDASLLVQAIIDAVIDLALPLAGVYNDLLADLELDVLTSPSITQCRQLYVCTSEINKMLRFLNPIETLVKGLRDHRAKRTESEPAGSQSSGAGDVTISPITHTYLGDVLDHCIVITEQLQQLKQSSDNLISLIFNTISAAQNRSMTQLTMVTIIFMPLTFMTGFFGMNFEEASFPDIHQPIWYFWSCAIPTLAMIILIVTSGVIRSRIKIFGQRKQIWSWKEQSKREPRRRRP